MLSGSISNAIATPFDVLKVRLQSSAAKELVKQETNVVRRFHDIFAREGYRGLWRGVGPTTSRAAVVAGAQLSTYDHAKMTLIRYYSDPTRFLLCMILVELCSQN